MGTDLRVVSVEYIWIELIVTPAEVTHSLLSEGFQGKDAEALISYS